ncbi:MAG: sugar O-acetyltransferase [Clostridia bacterium]|nr:sugar O-acetyltransferase [Clostridia bacterium]
MSKMSERLHTGELYLPGDETIMQKQLSCLDRLQAFNAIPPSHIKEKTALMKKMFAEMGEGCYIETPMHANWGGYHLHLGKNVYANFNLTLVDDTHIYIGDNTLLGPGVTLATAGHPICPALRAKGYQYNAPIRIGKNCWLGAGVMVMPGVTIGDDTVVGAGSIVTGDLPAGVVAVGNPCRVMREIGAKDREYYFKDRRIDWNDIEQ